MDCWGDVCDWLDTNDNKTLTDPPKEKEMTKSDQDRMKTLLTGLNEFFEHAGILHHAQHDRVNAVREFLKEKIAEETDEERFHIYWTEGKMWDTGMHSHNGYALFSRDEYDARSYTHSEAQERLVGMKGRDGMTLRFMPYGLYEEEYDTVKDEPKFELNPIPLPIKPEDLITLEPVNGLKEAPGREWYVIMRCGVFVGPSTLSREGEHVLAVQAAAKFQTAEEAFRYIENYGVELWKRGIWNNKPTVHKVNSDTRNLAVSEAIEKPQAEPKKKAYIIWSNLISGGKSYWTSVMENWWDIDEKKAFKYDSEAKARQVIKDLNWVNVHVKEVEVQTTKYRIKLCDGRWLSCFPTYRPNGAWLHTSHVNEINVCGTKIKPIEFDRYEDAQLICDMMTEQKVFRGDFATTTHIEEFTCG